MDSTAQAAILEQMAARLADLEHELAAARETQSAYRSVGHRWRPRLVRAGLVGAARLLVVSGVASFRARDRHGDHHVVREL